MIATSDAPVATCAVKTSNKKQLLIVNKAKAGKFNREEPFWKFGFLVPAVHSQSMEMDKKNDNKKWKEAEDSTRCQTKSVTGIQSNFY